MGQRKYPSLTPTEIIRILEARGFFLNSKKGDHRYYFFTRNSQKLVVQVDMGSPEYDSRLISLILTESKLSREEFYCSTKQTAKKINKCCVDDKELKNWNPA